MGGEICTLKFLEESFNSSGVGHRCKQEALGFTRSFWIMWHQPQGDLGCPVGLVDGFSVSIS